MNYLAYQNEYLSQKDIEGTERIAKKFAKR